jgi:hypothetical protein
MDNHLLSEAILGRKSRTEASGLKHKRAQITE